MLRADGSGYWFNTVDGNITDPDGGSATGWVPDFTSGAVVVPMASANVTLTPVQYGKPIIVITGALTSDLNLIFPNIENKWTVINLTTGAHSVSVKTQTGVSVPLAYGFVGDVACYANTIYTKLRLTSADFGTKGDGSSDDSSAFNYALSAKTGNRLDVPAGTYEVTALYVPSTTLVGAGKLTTVIARATNNNTISLTTSDDVVVKDLTVNNQKSINGFDGHGIVGNKSNLTIDGVNVIDYGASGAGGGTGVCLFHTGSLVSGLRLTNSKMIANPAASTSLGWLMEGAGVSFANNIYSYGANFCAHELKNSSTFCGLSNLIAEYTAAALYYGQDTGTGPSENVAVGVVGKTSDTGFTGGYANYNLTVGLLNDNTGAPGVAGTSHFARVDPGDGNALFGGLAKGNYVNTIRYNGNKNYTQLASHDTSVTLVTLLAGATKNATEIAHPGARNTVRDKITDSSGNAIRGANANPVWCHATGERIGSISGAFWDKLGTSGASVNSNHYWVREADQYAIETFLTPGNNGDAVGINYAIPGDTNYASVMYQKTANADTDYWFAQIGGVPYYRWYSSTFRPEADNTITLGTSGLRWSVVYAASGTINTSDEREKTFSDISDIETKVARELKGMIRKFQFNAAIEEKGAASARYHFGVGAQSVAEVFKKYKLDPAKYALFCYDEWDEQKEIVETWPEELDESDNVVREAGSRVIEPYRAAGNRYGIRYDELLCFIVGAM